MSIEPDIRDDEPRPNQIDWSQLLTEQQFARYNETKIYEASTAEKRVAAYSVICSQYLSILARYNKPEDISKIKEFFQDFDYHMWFAELRTCTVGYVVQNAKHTTLGGHLTVLYEIKIVGADGVNPMLSRHHDTALESQRASMAADKRDSLFDAQFCRLRDLHARLRIALSLVGWLEDEFGPEDPAKREARVAVRSTRYDPTKGGTPP